MALVHEERVLDLAPENDQNMVQTQVANDNSLVPIAARLDNGLPLLDSCFIVSSFPTLLHLGKITRVREAKMKINHKWTDDERAIIRRDYKHSRASYQRLAEYFSHLTREKITPEAVKGQIQIMGIAKSDDRHPWSPKEDDKLRDLIHAFCPRVVARMMHRSINSVVVRSKRLSISRRCRNGWFTKQEIMGILGHDHKWVQRRIDSGALPANYHYEHRPSQKGSSAWHIEEKDLKKFIKTYPEELVGCNIDIMMIVEIISGVNNDHE